MYTTRFLFTAINLLAALLVAAGAAVFHWATYGNPDALESPGIALGLLLILVGGAAVVGAGQRLEGTARRIDGITIAVLGLLLALIGRVVTGGVAATSGSLAGVLLLTIGAYLVGLDAKRFWPALLVGLATVPVLRFGEYAPLAGMPIAGWIAGATVGLVSGELRRMPIARVGLVMAAVAAALLIAVPAASQQSVFSSEWLGLFASLLWLAGWAFVGFAVLEKWPALPLMVATAAILCGAALEGPIPLEEGWRATLLGLAVAGILVPGLTGATYLIGAFFGGRTLLRNETGAPPEALASAPPEGPHPGT